MMNIERNRRGFLKKLVALGGVLGLSPFAINRMLGSEIARSEVDMGGDIATMEATMVSTWNHGMVANKAGFGALLNGGSSLDMIEAAARIVEADAEGLSVGIGGLPDRDGVVTLDACCMDHKGRAGSVACLEDIMYPLSVARKVMEETPHVMLVGDGARTFAIDQGFVPTNLLTEKAREAWIKWMETHDYKPVINIENHDTIGMLALDNEGRLSGGCTTSGVSFKMHGRVGDSPIIGAGLFVDGNVGAATATGLGEAVMRTVGSFLVVELMRGGMHPQAACEAAVKRIIDSMDVSELQVGYLALDKQGRYGAHAIHGGFNFALTTANSSDLIDASHG
jgi:isoaspartyl peptidase/L-asparaginase-like protein (Ntn-hydrolase superfamily)